MISAWRWSASHASSKPQRRQVQLLGVALELFVERGIEKVSIADLPGQAGVAHGLFYHYFASKDELLVAVLEHASPLQGFLAIAESMHGLPADEGLRLFAMRLGGMLEERGDVLRFIFRESLSPRSLLPSALVDVQQQVLEGLASYRTERIEAGELRPHDPRAPFRILISSPLVLELLKQPVEPWIDSFVDTILSGIRSEELRP
jgi:AcrR family transcriptional regulator